jgi:hypothetical protein
MEKAELIITALQQRISQMAGDHALEIALLRAELTELMNKQKAKDEYSQEIESKIYSENT